MPVAGFRIAGFTAGIAGVAFLLVRRFEFGLFLLVSAVGFLGFARLRSRALAEARRQTLAVGVRLTDLGKRIENGQTLDEIARDYEADEIPPTRTLLVAAQTILGVIGRGRDKQVVADFSPLLARQAALSGPPSAADLIARFSFAQNVFLIDHRVHSFSIPGQPIFEHAGLLVFARGYVYFFVDPGPETAGDLFAKGVVKEHVIHESRIPLLGAAAFAWETFDALREADADFLEPKLIASLQLRLALPGSFTIPIRQIASIGSLGEGGGLTGKQRLLIRSEDENGTVAEYHLATTQLMDDPWAIQTVDVLRCLCLLEGRLILF